LRLSLVIVLFHVRPSLAHVAIVLRTDQRVELDGTAKLAQAHGLAAELLDQTTLFFVHQVVHFELRFVHGVSPSMIVLWVNYPTFIVYTKTTRLSSQFAQRNCKYLCNITKTDCEQPKLSHRKAPRGASLLVNMHKRGAQISSLCRKSVVVVAVAQAAVDGAAAVAMAIAGIAGGGVVRPAAAGVIARVAGAVDEAGVVVAMAVSVVMLVVFVAVVVAAAGEDRSHGQRHGEGEDEHKNFLHGRLLLS